MKIKRNLLLVAMILSISSCGGLGNFGGLSGAQAEFEKGLKLFNQSKFFEAIPFFVKATELDSNYYKAFLYLGRSYINTGQLLESLNPLRSAYRISPTEARGEILNILVDSLFSLALTSLKSGNLSDFTTNIDEILQLKGNTAQAKLDLVNDLIDFGKDELSNGNISNSIRAFKSILNLSPNNFDAYLGLANAYWKDGNILKAISNVNKALKISPNNEDALSIYNSLIK